MTSVLFVHGTGVRHSGLQEYLTQLRAGLARIRPDVELHASNWGEVFGATLLAGGVSVPTELMQRRAELSPTRPLSDRGSAEVQVGLWAVLDSAPLAELETLLADRGQVHGKRNEPLARELADRLGRGLETGSELDRLLAACGLQSTGMAAATQLVASDQYAEITAFPPLTHAQRAAVLARAFTALALGLRDEELGSPAPVDGIRRERVELAAARVLAGPETAPGELHAQVHGEALNAILTLVTNWAARHRLQLTMQGAPGLGDLLKYLARGQGLRRHLRAELEAIEDDQLVVIAHSLGAVAAMDLLLEKPDPRIRMLVAVASQSGLLFELDALPGARFDTNLRPPHGFPATHFVYDPRDLLAYKANGLFGPGITDHRLDNVAPFPRNHGAYFGNQRFYEVLDRILPR